MCRVDDDETVHVYTSDMFLLYVFIIYLIKLELIFAYHSFNIVLTAGVCLRPTSNTIHNY
jgi:hypothetical protein